MQEEEWKMGKLINVSDYVSIRGDTLSAGTLKNGSGLKIDYYPSGALNIECEFSEGVPNGNWTYYYDNGKVAEEGKFKDGLREGSWRYYYSNGKIESSGNYEKDKKISIWIYYSRRGDILDKINEFRKE
jgi:antitoxin component YwqK of YwqJK toxin-antitoxin module